MTFQVPRPRIGALVVGLLLPCLLVLALGAAQARADGEEDPTYGDQGTAFAPLNAPDVHTGSRVDQGPDGGTVQAVGIDPVPDDNRGFSADDAIRVLHRDAAGTLSGLDGDGVVDVPLPAFTNPEDVLDVEVLDDGTIVVLYSTAPDGNAISFFSMNSEGTVVDGPERFFDSAECSGGDPVAGEIVSGSSLYVVWNCDGNEQLVHYSKSGESSFDDDVLELPESNGAVDLDLAPGGDLFVLVRQFTFSGARGGDPEGQVFRVSQDLVLDAGYGGGDGARVSGDPLVIGVDGADRAAVWTEIRPLSRGASSDWEIWRLDAAGEHDGAWGDGGLARLEHPDLGPPQFCSKGCFTIAEILSLADGRVIPMGFAAEESDRGSIERFQKRAIARTTATGQLDPAWDGDGVKRLELGQPNDGRAFFSSVYEPDVQTDGKVLVPHVTESEDFVERVPAPPDDWSANVTRLNATAAVVTENPPQNQTQTQTQQQQQEQQQQPRKCTSRRVFRIRLRKGTRNRKARILSARVTVNGKRVKVTRSDRLRSRVNLRNLPKGRYRVRIAVKLSNGKTVRETRRYRTCTRKIPHQLAPLRGR